METKEYFEKVMLDFNQHRNGHVSVRILDSVKFCGA